MSISKITRSFLVIIVNKFSKEWGGKNFCIRSNPYIIAFCSHEYVHYRFSVLKGYHQMHSNDQQKQYMVKTSIRVDIWIITGREQWNNNKTTTKQFQRLR